MIQFVPSHCLLKLSNLKGKTLLLVLFIGLNVNEFIVNTDSLIRKISGENKKCFIMGDFNLNLLNCQSQINQQVSGYYVI